MDITGGGGAYRDLSGEQTHLVTHRTGESKDQVRNPPGNKVIFIIDYL